MEAAPERLLMSTPHIHLAPMEGVIDAEMRTVLTRLGGYTQCVTEFLRVTQIILPDHTFYRIAPEAKADWKTPSGVPIHLQLLGGDPDLMARNAEVGVRLGTPGIDLNFGCPAKTVNRHDGGATILKTPERLERIVSAVRSVVPEKLPVSAKIRLGFDSPQWAVEIAQAAESGGASWLTVHARTKTDGYRPPAQWEWIAAIRQACELRVLANGDIWSVEDYHRCRQITAVGDVMLGRGAIAKPDLGRQIAASLSGESCPPLSWPEVAALVLELAAECQKQGRPHYTLARVKQWVKLLGRTYPDASRCFEEIKRIQPLPDLVLRLKQEIGLAVAANSARHSGCFSELER